MATKRDDTAECAICGKPFGKRELVAASLVRDAIAETIRREHPNWSENAFICRFDLGRFRARHVQDLLKTEMGELDALEEEVVRSLRDHELLSTNIEKGFDQGWTLGERLADRIAAFGGSWVFLSVFFVFLTMWIAANSMVAYWRPVDPYPFILLNLVLSCLAAIQAPIIMMSQNRQEAKDRVRSQHDYQVNLKSELEIRQLHEKIDHLLVHQWQRLVEIQEVQLDMLTELTKQAM